MFSICIPIYNYDVSPLVHDLHRQAIETGKPFEILLVDDASSSFLAENRALQSLDNVSYTELEQNIGRSKIRNHLAQLAQYPYLIFMDCDSAVSSSNYIANYTPYFRSNIVCYGGRIYEKEKPSNEKCLRWKYGQERESIPASKRMENPNYGFETNNFLIDKALFEKVQFSEDLKGYGHEDTLFGIQLLGIGTTIVHIENPLIHLGLEDAVVFLEKTESSVKNLKIMDQILQSNYPQYVNHSKLIRAKKTVDKLKVTPLMKFFFFVFKPLIKKNLLGKHPSLFLFDLHRLGIILS